MKRYLLLTFILISVCFLFSACGTKQKPMDLYDAIKERGKVVVGLESDIKPFSYIEEDGQPAGFEVDIAKCIAETLLGDKDAIEFIQVEPSNRISFLNSGRADMVIATITINPKRMAMVDFSEPYYIAGQTVMVKKSSDIKSLSDLKNKKIGTIFGTTAINGIRAVAPTSLISGYKTYDDALKAIKNNQIDAIALDDTILLSFILQDNSFRMLNQKYTQEPYGIAFRKGTESTRVLNAVNVMLNNMANDGDLNSLRQKWIKD